MRQALHKGGLAYAHVTMQRQRGFGWQFGGQFGGQDACLLGGAGRHAFSKFLNNGHVRQTRYKEEI